MAANDVPCCETMFWVYLVICIALVAFAGLMSGLTLGLMSLSLVDLEVLIKAGEPADRKNAEKILPIVKNQHLLLCTLLICNALAMEALPIFIDALLPAWGAILISVTLILAFGEIIPQALCSRYGLSIGARLSPLVRLLLIAVFPISYPISKLLDFLLGKGHSALLRRAELKTLVNLHGNEAGKGGELTHDETTIIAGALDLTQKTAKDAMTPLSTVFSLDLYSKLNDETMSLILNRGHSRVPIYSGTPTNIVGLILVKNLIKCRPEDETPISHLSIRSIPRIRENLPLYDILNQFQKGDSHMAVVVKSNCAELENAAPKSDMVKINVHSMQERGFERGKQMRNEKIVMSEILGNSNSLNSSDVVLGIITMEDVLEELLQEPILDETDEYVDVHNRIKINLLPSMKRSSSPRRSPGASPRRQTPTLRSPISPYVQSPLAMPPLSSSPVGCFTAISPPHHSTTSTPSPQVSRKSYERLEKPGD
ncbi:PREDICTED: DUF21 domain-containing protein At5g52790 isoform X2 [Ipomoea nil]|uniref:DUF21 domain-containing protein At5g52790 isoform X2 n=1 Tax=Ipomoea nil TaxID=35883 RepID=UPI0009015A7D|nr:PREDICTED: DUF21 domain-containing protein At5g52790 isoform X2 [Ipomoea nil]